MRDMDGFPWPLAARDAVNARAAAWGPTDSAVAGTIIASYPLDDYAVVVTSSEDARRLVRQQAACGYDFIKVHNLLRPPMFDAVADQAKRFGLRSGRPRRARHHPGPRAARRADADHRASEGLPDRRDPGNPATRTMPPPWPAPRPDRAGCRTQRGYDRGAWARGVLASTWPLCAAGHAARVGEPAGQAPTSTWRSATCSRRPR